MVGIRLLETVLKVAVEEDERLPATCNPVTLEEALLIKPLKTLRAFTLSVEANVVAPAAWSVPEALSAPATCNPALKEDEALEMKPPKKF